MRCLFCVALFGLNLTAADPAPPVLRTAGNAGKELSEAQRLISTGKVVEGVDLLRKVMDEAGTELVTLDGSHYLPLNVVAQGVLLSLPEVELTAYRNRIDGLAKELLAQGKTNEDARPLLTIVEKYFASTVTEETLLTLAEWSYARGDNPSAITHWTRLLPRPEKSVELVVPNPKTPPAWVRARILLARIEAGDLERVRVELPSFREAFPQMKGNILGIEGNLADIVTKRLELGRIPDSPRPPTGDWHTLGGDVSRSGRATCQLPRTWSSRPTWQTKLKPDNKPMPSGRPVSSRGAAVHPVVWQRVVYAADAMTVSGYDLDSGAPRFRFDLREQLENLDLADEKLPATYDADFALTVGADRLFARLGSTAIPAPPSADGLPSSTTSWLVAFGQTHGKETESPLKYLWKLAPPVAEGVNAAWEAAPVVHRGRLYAAFTMEAKGGTVQAIACYSISHQHPGKPYWVTEVADVPVATQTEVRRRAEPLTVSGESVVLCTHSGAIIAVNAQSGKPRWGFTYPNPAKALGGQREVSPAVAHGGQVFAAPTDADQLLALDAVTGAKLWAVEGIAVEQILGVVDGKVIAALSAPNRGIRAFDVNTGSTLQPHGWAIHDDPWLMSFGRGLVTNDAILWPTKSGVFFIRPSDGLPLPARLPNPHGNLALADGVLVVGTVTGVMAYVPNGSSVKVNPLVRADDADRQRDFKQAEQLRTSLIKDVKQEVSERAYALAMLALTRPKTAEGFETLRRELPECDTLRDEFVLNRDGIPTRLKHLFAAHFGTPFEATPTTPNTATWPKSKQPRPASTSCKLPNPRCVPLTLSGSEPLEFHPVSDGVSLHMIDISTGAVAWSAPWPVGRSYSMALAESDGLYCIGADAICKFNAEGKRLWFSDWPATPPLLPESPGRMIPEMEFSTSPEFREPQISCTMLFLKRGAFLVAVDTRTGEFLWVNRPIDRWTSPALARRFAEPLGDGAPRWADSYTVKNQSLFAHNGVGQLCILDTAMGEPFGQMPSSLTPWRTPPVSIGSDLWAVPSGPGTDYGVVSLVELQGKRRTPRERNRKQSAGETSLTGEPPMLLGGRTSALVLTPRTIGTEVTLLSESGNDSMARGVLIPEINLNLKDATKDDVHAYIPAGNQLWTFRWADGKTAYNPVTLDANEKHFTLRKAGTFIVALGHTINRGERRVWTGFTPNHWLASLEALTTGTQLVCVFDGITGEVVARHQVPVCGAACLHPSENFVTVLSVGRAAVVKLR